MKTTLRSPNLTLVWFVLLAATAGSWMLSGLEGAGIAETDRVARLAIVAVAFFKTRLVLMHFMEVARAPWPLRIAIEAWGVVVCGALMLQFW